MLAVPLALVLRWTAGSPGGNLSRLGLAITKRAIMQQLYCTLAAVHVVAIVVTGVLWTAIDLNHRSRLRPHLRDIRAVHFGSLYLVPWFLGLAYAFDRLRVEPWQQLLFPIGLGALVFFSGVGYLFPRPAGIDPFYFWTRGWGLFFSMIGLFAASIGLLWTAVILISRSLGPYPG